MPPSIGVLLVVNWLISLVGLFSVQAISLSCQANAERLSAKAHVGSKVVVMVTCRLYAPPTSIAQESSCLDEVSATLLITE